MHDLVIRNARLYDGGGAAGTVGDLAVAGGRIAELGAAGGAAGRASVGEGREEVDAEGLALMPGIIDSHTHYDAQVTWDPGLTPERVLIQLAVGEEIEVDGGPVPVSQGDRGAAVENPALWNAPRMRVPKRALRRRQDFKMRRHRSTLSAWGAPAV